MIKPNSASLPDYCCLLQLKRLARTLPGAAACGCGFLLVEPSDRPFFLADEAFDAVSGGGAAGDAWGLTTPPPCWLGEKPGGSMGDAPESVPTSAGAGAVWDGDTTASGEAPSAGPYLRGRPRLRLKGSALAGERVGAVGAAALLAAGCW